jgi:hypothetical protein
MADQKADPTPKELLLMIVSAFEEIGAVSLYLKNKGLIDADAFHAARAQSKGVWAQMRNFVETEPAEAAETLREFLKSFEGPIQ